MGEMNLLAGWIGILAGFVAGAVSGLLFHKDDWLGGYASWPRRLVRLGHISFFGIAFINIAFYVTFRDYGVDGDGVLKVASWMLVAGAMAMPLCCYGSAFRKSVRHLFFIPVLCLVIAAALSLWKGWLS